MSTPQHHSNAPAILILILIQFLGIYCMYGGIWRNGYISSLIELLRNGPYLLPLSNTPIVYKYTGFRFLDSLFALANVMWANVTDLSNYGLTVYAVQFAGQLVPVWTLMVVESARKGSAGSGRRDWLKGWKFIPWALAMQTLGYGFVMPIWCIVQLSTSPQVTSTNLPTEGKKPDSSPSLADTIRPDASITKVLPYALYIGYLIPTALYAYYHSERTTQQYILAIWQLHPLYLYLIITLLSHLPSKFQPRPIPHLLHTPTFLTSLNFTYQFAIAMATMSQVLSFSVVLLPKIAPRIFFHEELYFLSLADVFVPNPPWKENAGRTWQGDVNLFWGMGFAMHDFFKWDQYVGSCAGLVWAGMVWWNSLQEMKGMRVREGKEGEIGWREDRIGIMEVLKLVRKVTGNMLLSGPASGMLVLIRERDRIVLGGEEDGKVE